MMEIISWMLVGCVLAAVPVVLGFLRRGLFPFIISFVIIVIYIILFLVADVRLRSYGLREEDAFLIVVRTYIAITIIASVVVYMRESKQLDLPEDNFYDDNLFYQYGLQVQSEIIPINLPETSKSDSDTSTVKENLHNYLINQLNTRFSSDNRYSLNEQHISDLYLKEDERDFVLFSFTTARDSVINYCINTKIVGRQLVVNTKVFIRSYSNWYDVLLHVVTSPLHYWIWVFSF